MRFSERYGHVQVREALQVDGIDAPLRNALWNVFDDFANPGDPYRATPGICYRIWTDLLGNAKDSLGGPTYKSFPKVRVAYFALPWHRAYDFMECVYENAGGDSYKKQVGEAINKALTRWGSGYRMVDGNFIRLVDDAEVDAIQTALDASAGAGARSHLSKALTLLSDRESPDYANSIKESISAVEATCSQIVGKQATLGATLKKLEESGIETHKALIDAWGKLYGYTSDADGIRHSSLDVSTVDLADALYFLVSCSAFINLLNTRASGITPS